MALGKNKNKIENTIFNQKAMIHRREFEDKTKELLRIVYYNLQTSIGLSLLWKDVKVEKYLVVGVLWTVFLELLVLAISVAYSNVILQKSMFDR